MGCAICVFWWTTKKSNLCCQIYPLKHKKNNLCSPTFGLSHDRILNTTAAAAAKLKLPATFIHMQSEKGPAVSCACIKSTYKFIPCVCVCYGYCGKDKTSLQVAWWLWLNRRLMSSCCHFGQIDGPNVLRNEIVQLICIHQHLVERVTRTPTNQDVPPEVFLLREEGDS